MNFKTALAPFSEEPLTKQVLLELLKEYKRPFDKINELVKQKMLVSVKNGLCFPGQASLVRDHILGTIPLCFYSYNIVLKIILNRVEVLTYFILF